MKTNELMIGDWVLYGRKYAIVKRIATDRVTILVPINKREELVEETYDNIDPIPLTPKILEKNSFKVISVVIVGAREMRWVSDDARTEITIWTDDWLPMEIIKNVYDKDEMAYTLPFPSTVHELQHALRLCGIDKEIEL